MLFPKSRPNITEHMVDFHVSVFFQHSSSWITTINSHAMNAPTSFEQLHVFALLSHIAASCPLLASFLCVWHSVFFVCGRKEFSTGMSKGSRASTNACFFVFAPTWKRTASMLWCAVGSRNGTLCVPLLLPKTPGSWVMLGIYEIFSTPAIKWNRYNGKLVARLSCTAKCKMAEKPPRSGDKDAFFACLAFATLTSSREKAFGAETSLRQLCESYSLPWPPLAVWGRICCVRLIISKACYETCAFFPSRSLLFT